MLDSNWLVLVMAGVGLVTVVVKISRLITGSLTTGGQMVMFVSIVAIETAIFGSAVLLDKLYPRHTYKENNKFESIVNTALCGNLSVQKSIRDRRKHFLSELRNDYQIPS